jgi:SOS-response transcriptional repressor LexA
MYFSDKVNMYYNPQDISLKTYTLTQDEPIMGSVRSGIQINFQAGDQLFVHETQSPTPGSLIVVKIQNLIRLCRFEKIHGNDYIFPPLGVDPSEYPEYILGQVIDRVRLSNWLLSET